MKISIKILVEEFQPVALHKSLKSEKKKELIVFDQSIQCIAANKLFSIYLL